MKKNKNEIFNNAIETILGPYPSTFSVALILSLLAIIVSIKTGKNSDIIPIILAIPWSAILFQRVSLWAAGSKSIIYKIATVIAVIAWIASLVLFVLFR